MKCNITGTKSKGTATLRWKLSVWFLLVARLERSSSHERAQHDATYKYHMCKMNLEIKEKPLHEKWGAQMQVI